MARIVGARSDDFAIGTAMLFFLAGMVGSVLLLLMIAVTDGRKRKAAAHPHHLEDGGP